MAKRKSINKQASSYWLVPAVITVIVGCALMWYWGQMDIKNVEMEEQSLILPSNPASDTTTEDAAEVKGATTSDELDAMFKKLDITSTSSEDLSDLAE